MVSQPNEFEAFWNAVVVERADGTIGPFGQAAAPFQWDFLRAARPVLERIAGRQAEVRYHWFWSERHRGASKSSDATIALLPVLLFSPMPRRMIIVACDQVQAGVLIRICAAIIKANPALANLKIDKWKISNPATLSEVEIMSSDVESFYGQLVDVIVADEICLWKREELWEAVVSTMAKKQHAALIVTTNSGWRRSWPWQVREQMRQLSHVWFHAMEGFAPWIQPWQLQAQAKILDPSAYRRLWLNEWIAGTENGINPEDVQAALTLPGPIEQRQPGQGCVAGLDIGLRRDHSSFAVLLLDYERGRIQLADMYDWAPPKGGKVKFADIRAGIWKAVKQFNLAACTYDPWQCESISEELQAVGLFMEPRNSYGADMSERTVSLVEAFRDGRVDLFPHELLLDDLARASILDRPSGKRIESPRTADGHGDRLTAFSLALQVGMRCLANPPQQQGAYFGGQRLPDGPVVTFDQFGPILGRAQRMEDEYHQRLEAIRRW